MSKPVALIVSLVYWPVFLALSTFFCAVSLFLWLLMCWSPLRGRAAHIGTCLWGWCAMRVNPLWHFSWSATEAASRSSGAVVYVANHASQLDILSLAATFRQFKFVSKKSVFFLPIYGWAMLAAGYVPLSRGEGESIKKMMRDCRKLLEGGESLLVYPEGTRSADGALQPFKRGAFQLAQKAGVSIVPVVIRGSSQALRKGSLLCRPANVSLKLCAPIPADHVKASNPKQLCEEVYQLFKQELASS